MSPYEKIQPETLEQLRLHVYDVLADWLMTQHASAYDLLWTLEQIHKSDELPDYLAAVALNALRELGH